MRLLSRRELMTVPAAAAAALLCQRRACAVSPLSGYHPRQAYPTDIELLPDGRNFVTADSDGGVRIWDLKSGTRIAMLPGHYGGASSVAVSPDGKWIASGGGDKKCRLWDVKKRRERSTYEAGEGIRFVTFSADGKHLLFCTSREVQVIEWRNGRTRKLNTREGQGGFMSPARMNEDSIVAGQGDHAVRIWDLVSGDLKVEIPVDDWPEAVHCSARSRRLSIALTDGTAFLWSLEKRRIISRISEKPGFPGVLHWANDGETLLAATNNRAPEIWNVAKERLVSTLDTHINTTSCGRFSDDGSKVVIGHDIGRVAILETRTGRLVREFKLIEEYFDRPGPGGWEKLSPINPLPLGRVF